MDKWKHTERHDFILFYFFQNKEICLNIGTTLIDDKTRESRLRWFGHV